LFSRGGTQLDFFVGTNETLSRFIFSTRHFSRQPPRVKAEAFMPNQGEVSVFRVDGLTGPQIWEIGTDIAEKRHRNLYARGDTRAREVRQTGLDVSPMEPPARHANIVGWPEDDKPRQKLIALQLAAAATLVLSE
jgi:hypothetical protein